MPIFRSILFMIALPWITFSAQAEIYRYVDSDGVITYSDQPQEKAEKVILPKLNISKPAPTKTLSTTDTATDAATTPSEKTTDQTQEPARKPYTEFVIDSPQDKATFQNQTSVAIVLKINPPLQTGDKIQFFMDNKALASPSTATGITVQKVEKDEQVLTRGEHQLHAVILDKNNQVIKQTPTITIYVHYAHVQSHLNLRTAAKS